MAELGNLSKGTGTTGRRHALHATSRMNNLSHFGHGAPCCGFRRLLIGNETVASEPSKRVDFVPVDHNFEVQMAPGGSTGGSTLSYQLSPGDLLAR